jgi:hypothetical protein
LRLLSSALGKTGRRISLSQLFWFDIDCSGDLSRLDKTALLFFNSGLIGPRLRSDFWLNLCLRFGRTNLCGGGKIFTQKLIQTLFATSSWIFCRNLLNCISQPLILGWKTERGTLNCFD